MKLLDMREEIYKLVIGVNIIKDIYKIGVRAHLIIGISRIVIRDIYLILPIRLLEIRGSVLSLTRSKLSDRNIKTIRILFKNEHHEDEQTKNNEITYINPKHKRKVKK